MNYKIILSKSLSLILLITAADVVSAQSTLSGNSTLIYSLIAIGVLLFIAAVVTISDNFLQMEADKAGLDTEKNNFSIFPKMSEIFSKPTPEFTEGKPVHRLKKGHNIILAGAPEKSIVASNAKTFAMQPTNFRGMSPIPKVTVAAGDEVLAGDVIFFDKKEDRIKYVAPVSGEIVEIKRGAKRAITEVIILADKDIRYKSLETPSLDGDRQDIVDFLLGSGGWSLLNQRPFDIVPHPDSIPSNIFISTFDTAPLAPDLGLALKGKEAEFQKGIDVLAKLTTGKVHLGLNLADGASSFSKVTGAEKNWFSGVHPAGNVGIQIHHTAPINSTDKVWTLKVQDVITLGGMFLNGKFDASRIVALTGAELNEPKYVSTYIGANIKDLLDGNIKGDNTRIIAGDVLSGKKVEMDSFIGIGDDQITVVKEGNKHEMFGWLLPITPRPTISKTFPNFLYKDHAFEAETNTHGEKRAFVMTGQYESVLPMDIYPQHLMKAIMANDFERMEGFGINELSEEDLALCEFVCTSKMPLQKILREGLDLMREQG